jgi:tetrapyrrole methylase family protein/MazG family protein
MSQRFWIGLVIKPEHPVKAFEELIEIVEKLRGPAGCPWDKAQTHQSLTPYAIEEAHELEEAIHCKDVENIKEELGDLLFQSVLHSEIAKQEGNFDIHDVITHLNQKMVHRHPHVFSDTQVKDAGEVVQNWEKLKDKEKNTKKVFDIPKSFPALLRAHKIGKRARKMDFGWNTYNEVLADVEGELKELKEALQSQDQTHIEEELGDLLFSVAQLARHLDLDAEKALRLSNEKFVNRFEKMLAVEPEFEDLPRDQKEKLWQKVKELLKS